MSSIVVSENQFRARSSLSVISSTGSSTATTTAGAAATLPIDFGESLPPNLTTLVNKQFRLYRIKKTAEQMGANNGEWMDRWMGDLNCYVVYANWTSSIKSLNPNLFTLVAKRVRTGEKKGNYV